jgi:hypothetical protein
MNGKAYKFIFGASYFVIKKNKRYKVKALKIMPLKE